MAIFYVDMRKCKRETNGKTWSLIVQTDVAVIETHQQKPLNDRSN